MKKILIVLMIFTVVFCGLITYSFNQGYMSDKGIYFSYINVNKNQVTLKCESLDSFFVIKKIDVYENNNILYLKVYKGRMTKKVENGSSINYTSKSNTIDKIILVGKNEQLTEIWTKPSTIGDVGQ